MYVNKKVHGVVAMGKNGVIGNRKKLPNQLPWPPIREDMKHFQDITIPHSALMGRSTWESIPEKHRPLRDRENLVVSRNPQYNLGPYGDKKLVGSIEGGIEIARTDIVCIIGGAQIYEQTLPYMDKIYVTRIDALFEGEVFFPGFHSLQSDEWELIYQRSIVAEVASYRALTIHFEEYERVL